MTIRWYAITTQDGELYAGPFRQREAAEGLLARLQGKFFGAGALEVREWSR